MQRHLQTAVILAVLLVAGWFLYQPGTGGVFLLDDFDTLGGLSGVEDFESAMRFVGSFTQGPFGRPLAMASFAPQYASWDTDPASFLRVNIAIHLLNGLLVFLFFRQLCSALRLEQSQARFAAITATALWLFMPLLASSTLLVVQRMTTLSATMVVAGLNFYLVARRKLGDQPAAALRAMSAVLVLATLAAVLFKENGALLPTLVLVLELTVLSRPSAISKAHWRTWAAVFLVLPTAALCAYLLWRVPYSESTLARRDFNVVERLLTQTRVLWEYLAAAWYPRSSAFSPFHDAYPVARTLFDPVTLVAMTSWIAVCAAAVKVRRKYPLFAFAVLWYLGGHMLESTTVPLELYFEHRNYVPIMGPVFAFCAFLVTMPGKHRSVVRLALPAYIVVHAGLLFSVTSLWGQPMIAAGNWYSDSPQSMRAVANLANRQMREMGPAVGALTLAEFARENPEHSYLGIARLAILCNHRPDVDYSADVDNLHEVLPTTGFSYTAGEMLDKLQSVVQERSCAGVDSSTVSELADTMMQNPRYRTERVFRQYHQQLKARIAWDAGDTNTALTHLRNAHEILPERGINTMMVTALLVDERFGEAREFLESASGQLPLNPFRRWNARQDLEELNRYIDATERQVREDETSAEGVASIESP